MARRDSAGTCASNATRSALSPAAPHRGHSTSVESDSRTNALFIEDAVSLDGFQAGAYCSAPLGVSRADGPAASEPEAELAWHDATPLSSRHPPCAIESRTERANLRSTPLPCAGPGELLRVRHAPLSRTNAGGRSCTARGKEDRGRRRFHAP